MAKKQEQVKEFPLPFGKKNYIFLGIGIFLVFFGYFLMSGEEFVDVRDGFSLALHVCPWVIVAGLCVVGYGIMLRPDHMPAQKGTDIQSPDSTSQS